MKVSAIAFVHNDENLTRETPTEGEWFLKSWSNCNIKQLSKCNYKRPCGKVVCPWGSFSCDWEGDVLKEACCNVSPFAFPPVVQAVCQQCDCGRLLPAPPHLHLHQWAGFWLPPSQPEKRLPEEALWRLEVRCEESRGGGLWSLHPGLQ